MLFSIYIYIYIYISSLNIFLFSLRCSFGVWLLYSQSRPHEHGHEFQRLTRVDFDFFRSFLKKRIQFHSPKFNCLGIDLHVFFSLYFFWSILIPCPWSWEKSSHLFFISNLVLIHLIGIYFVFIFILFDWFVFFSFALLHLV